MTTPMKQETYEKLFKRMDELGAIRVEEVCFDEPAHESQDPLLSDCMKAIIIKTKWWSDVVSLVDIWNLDFPHLHQQSEELGQTLIKLLV